jgi:hypothetical protein
MKRVGDFEKWQLLLGATGVVISTIGGWWSYRNIIIQRVEARNISVQVKSHLVSENSEHPLLEIDTLIHNIGNVAVTADQRGIELTVIEYKNPQLTAAKNENIIDWYTDKNDIRTPTNRYNILKQYGNTTNTYLLNPGVEFKESVITPVSRGTLYGIRVRFFVSNDGGTMSDFHYAYVP